MLHDELRPINIINESAIVYSSIRDTGACILVFLCGTIKQNGSR